MKSLRDKTTPLPWAVELGEGMDRRAWISVVGFEQSCYDNQQAADAALIIAEVNRGPAVDELIRLSKELLEAFVSEVNSRDYGSEDPEEMPEVACMRSALSKLEGETDERP